MWDFLSIIPISIIVIIFLIFVLNFYLDYSKQIEENVRLDASISNLNYFIMKNTRYSTLRIPNKYDTSFGIEVNGRSFGKRGNIFVEFPELIDNKIVEVKGYA